MVCETKGDVWWGQKLSWNQQIKRNLLGLFTVKTINDIWSIILNPLVDNQFCIKTFLSKQFSKFQKLFDKLY